MHDDVQGDKSKCLTGTYCTRERWHESFIWLYFTLQVLCMKSTCGNVMRDYKFGCNDRSITRLLSFLLHIVTLSPLCPSQMVLQNVDKAQVKLKMKKDNVVGVWGAVHTDSVHIHLHWGFPLFSISVLSSLFPPSFLHSSLPSLPPSYLICLLW